MSGYQTPYGENIRNILNEFNKKNMIHYEKNALTPIQQLKYNGQTISSTPFYKGENMAPYLSNLTEADKELRLKLHSRSVEDAYKKDKKYNPIVINDSIEGAGFGRVRLPSSRKARSISSYGAEKVIDVGEKLADILPVPDVVKKGMKGLKVVKDIVKNKGAGKNKKVEVIDCPKCNKIMEVLNFQGKGFSGGKKLKRNEWNNLIKGIEDKDIKKLFEKYKKGIKYGKGCTVGDFNKHLEGKGFWEDFGKGFMSVIRPVTSVLKTVAPVIAPGIGHLASKGLDAVGLGKSGDSRLDEVIEDKQTKKLDNKLNKEAVLIEKEKIGGKKKTNKKKTNKNEGVVDPVIEKLLGGVIDKKEEAPKKETKTKAPKKASDKMKRRAELVKKIMKDRGVKLVEASKIIKNEGLKY